jgi:hypothetical protein
MAGGLLGHVTSRRPEQFVVNLAGARGRRPAGRRTPARRRPRAVLGRRPQAVRHRRQRLSSPVLDLFPPLPALRHEQGTRRRPLPGHAGRLAHHARSRPDHLGRNSRPYWGASPNYELFRTVLGIHSAAPGFRRVIVRPYLGKLTHASGAIPHPGVRLP